MSDKSDPPQFYQAQSYTAEESVGYLMKRIMMSIAFQANKRLGEHDLTTAQWSPMMKLRFKGSATVAELAKWCQTDAGAMTRLLDRLEKKNLCKRTRSIEDRRVVVVELTPEGAAAMEHVPEVLSDVMNMHLSGFSRTEWLNLKSYLSRMVDTADRLRDDN